MHAFKLSVLTRESSPRTAKRAGTREQSSRQSLAGIMELLR